MTRDEAIALREAQLNGKVVDPFMFAVALRTIRETKEKKPPRVHEGGKPHQVLRKLASGPMDRHDLYQALKGESSTYESFKRLMRAGLIRCEVKLTEDGLRALGLVGPRL